MLKKIITKLKFGSCKTKVVDDTNAVEESGKNEPEKEEKWSLIAKTVLFIGKEIQIVLERYLHMKKPI